MVPGHDVCGVEHRCNPLLQGRGSLKVGSRLLPYFREQRLDKTGECLSMIISADGISPLISVKLSITYRWIEYF